MNPQATKPPIMQPTPHQAASHVISHCLLCGTYLAKATKNAREFQLGAAPATMVKAEQTNRETLNANLRPMISAVEPQKRAPRSMPVYKAIVSDLAYEGLNSNAAWPAIMPWSETCRESTPCLDTAVRVSNKYITMGPELTQNR